MLSRTLAIPLRRASLPGKPVLVQGPRGAGKTMLLRNAFPAHTYVTLDDPVDRARARQDPRAFLGRLRGPAVIDDVHRAPGLIGCMEGLPALVLASSLRLQTPFTTFELYPPTQAELEGRPPLALDMLGRFETSAGPASRQLGTAFAPNRSWLDRDVRALVNVHDPERFEVFFALAEARSGTVLDQQAMAAECGVSHRTVVRWLGVLDACFRTLRLPASRIDFGRRLVRSPKLHFLESASLESRAVAEIYKNARHLGIAPELAYWRDSNGFEIPLIIQTDTAPMMPVCIAAQPNPSDIGRLRRWMEMAGVSQGAMIAEDGRQLRRRGILSYAIGKL